MRLMFLCRLSEYSWGHIASLFLYVHASVHMSVKVSVNLFEIAPVQTGFFNQTWIICAQWEPSHYGTL